MRKSKTAVAALPQLAPMGEYDYTTPVAPPVDIESDAPASPEVTAAAAPKSKTTPAAFEALPAYAARMEAEGQPLAVCQIVHPDAVDGTIFDGVYAGIRLVNGPVMSARLSDGSTI